MSVETVIRLLTLVFVVPMLLVLTGFLIEERKHRKKMRAADEYVALLNACGPRTQAEAETVLHLISRGLYKEAAEFLKRRGKES